ncbi:MAG: DUF4301 family protein [Bacteroidales bacterium]|jgi:hypothetical protein|nr:DUF4301 family protein [Bacteroidales bacterium]MDD4383660.1 DUF4301 family protein [Bacteroidales bacterium]MDY0197258.1 DUF4301 family protein [Tenuifilaceae bacterium]
MLSEKDIIQLEGLGMLTDQIYRQIDNFKVGFPPIDLVKPATVNDGIIKLECYEVDDLIEIYKSYEGVRLKFVPASGAATRMFEALIKYTTTGENNASVEEFVLNLCKFPFYNDLKEELSKKGLSPNELIQQENFKPIIDALLDANGLNYGSLPKGLIKFHRYNDYARTAFEEQLIEGTQYARMPNNEVSIHLTVSPEHLDNFKGILNSISPEICKEYDVKLNVTFSEQNKCTDTIAVDNSNIPIRDSEGNLLFRPGGHGALIQNLNKLSGDIIFIKNIDNVVPDRLKPQTVLYKKALAGLLISYQSIIFDYLSLLQSDGIGIEQLNEILDFTINELCILPPSGFEVSSTSALKTYLHEKLNRPLRVCGMVKNEGEPGGGPFWVTNSDGTISLQIIESSQVDKNNTNQKEIFGASTHFNPVDLICATKDVDGQKFDLLNYTDPATGFITTKSKDGREMKVQELPGLWNGAMAYWNTIFVEVPLATFNPVKTVLDLLRDQHRE